MEQCHVKHRECRKHIRLAVVACLIIVVTVYAACTRGAVPADPAAKAPSSLRYENADYGFSVTLPAAWGGYAVIVSTWEGFRFNEKGEADGTETGPLLSIRHPSWTEADPYQDIPVMILTYLQWENTQSEALQIGAAPLPPGELARNKAYVFALPARYNFAYPRGFEEVDAILKGGAVQASL